MIQSIFAVVLSFTLLSTAFSQTAEVSKPEKDKAAVQREAVLFLRETMSDINTMRSLENRISFAAELAGLMWFHDEREARAMYSAVFGDFRQLLLNYDAQMNAFGVEASDISSGGGFMSMMTDPTDRQRIGRKFGMAMMVRQQIAMSIAEHDSELAFSFYNDSLAAVSNPAFRKQGAEREPFFEQKLIL